MEEKPLIWTTKGNLPISSLQYRHQWTETAAEITLVEEYLLGEEIVKRNVHVMLKRGAVSHIDAGGVI